MRWSLLSPACTCTYEDRIYSYGDTIYNTTDGLGACLTAICGDNGTLIRRVTECPGTPTTVPFTFTTTSAALSTTGRQVHLRGKRGHTWEREDAGACRASAWLHLVPLTHLLPGLGLILALSPACHGAPSAQ